MACGANLNEGHLVARVAFQPAGELQLEQDGDHRRRRDMALPDEFVNRDRCRAEPLDDLVLRRIPRFAAARSLASADLAAEAAVLRP